MSGELRVWVKPFGDSLVSFQVSVKQDGNIDNLKDAIKAKMPKFIICDAPELNIHGRVADVDCLVSNLANGKGAKTPIYFQLPEKQGILCYLSILLFVICYSW